MINVAITDAHGVVREGLRQTLQASGGFDIVGEAFDGASTLALARITDAVLLTLGLSMRGVHGLDLIPLIKTTNPSLRILVVTMQAEESYAARAFKAGASGYITKACSPVDFIDAARRVAAGGVYVSLAVANQFAQGLSDTASAMPHQRLSARELEILLRIAAGESRTVIAQKLGLSTKTIGTHRTNVLKKMGFASDAALVRYAMRHGLVEEDGLDAL